MAGGKDQFEMGAVVMEGLLGEFRAGNIGQPGIEKTMLTRHLGELSRRWDEYLKRIIVKFLTGCEGATIMNPACVWGRHSRGLARRLAGFTVIGTDINPRFDRLYNRLPHSRTPSNY